ncbi:MAG: SDR family oxidoreductase [Clostridiales bacterium]|nr:SDR family oxidoreductase [Clostridiales bacterium]
MHILVTGAKGFIGRNLMMELEQRAQTTGDVLCPIDLDTPARQLEEAIRQADFVFHLAGVNRPRDPAEFTTGNRDFTVSLLSRLEAAKKPPVVLTSSIQAALENPYGQSKLAAEEALAAYGRRTGSAVFPYRLPNAFGKWSRPNYNSAIATFCSNLTRGLPITVNDPAVELTLVYIDDIVAEFLQALDGCANRQGEFCAVEPVHRIRLGDVAELLRSFGEMRNRLEAPDQSDPFTRKLYATYLSFLPPDDFARTPVIHSDERGSFTELLHLGGHGQVSLNVSKPHITKGEHWHHTKHEKFIVVQGEGIIRFRKPGDSTVISYRVSGDTRTVVDIPPGYTHNIENLGDTDLLTIMWANECFDPAHPDTYRLPVAPERKD